MSSRREARARRLADEAQAVGTRAGEALPYSCPPELRRCVVWDWLERDEVADVEQHGMNSLAVIRAWRRWQAARQAYAADVGKQESHACGPMGRPTLG